MSVHQLTPLPVVVPLLAAAAIVVTGPAPRRVHDAIATAAAVATTVVCAVLLGHAQHGPIVEWLGGWRPHHRVATGIALAVDQLGAGCALLAMTLLSAALVYSWAYFDELDGLVHALMLTLGAGMVGFCFAGDLFTMIVFFVLMTVAAVALTGVENEHTGPLQGAINFAVLNSIAGFGALMGAALTYGRTGALNLAQIGLSFDHHPPDALVAVAFALLAVAFLTKAGVAPFHFWLPDAHAVAPTPASAVFSGGMTLVALFGVARLTSTAFAQPIAMHTGAVRALLVGVGVVTAVVAASACTEQRQVKRLIAFATAQQVGVVLCGIGLLSDDGLAGAALTVLGAGLVLAALFTALGVVIRHHGATDEFELQGSGREARLAGIAFIGAGLALATLPFTVGFGGSALIGDAARAVGYDWLPVVLALTSAVAGGSVLRAGLRVFFGLGTGEPSHAETASEDRSQQESSHEEEQETDERRPPSRLLATIPLLLLLAAIVLGVLPGLSDSVRAAAAHFRDFGSYVRVVLDGAVPRYAATSAGAGGVTAWIYALATLAAAALVAALGLRGRRLLPAPLLDALRGAHSGHVGDYTAWWTFGMTVIGGLALWALAG